MAVYFAESCGYIKIGYSKNPFKRVGSITRHGKRPDDIPQDARAELIGWVPGGHWQEGAMHARFIDRRVAGEWFRIDRSEIVDLIWADPRGYDFKGMTYTVAVASFEYPELTRDQLEEAGVRILPYTREEQRERARELFGDWAVGGAA